ncbi:MAG: ureidoglycolate lyase [Synechococcus sp.]
MSTTLPDNSGHNDGNRFIFPMTAVQLRSLQVIPITSDNFEPFGQVIAASKDGTPFSPADAQLVLDRGTPRFYIMRLKYRGLSFKTMTRHQQCTQCLGALEGKEWVLAVSPPSPTPKPALAEISAFRIPGNCFVKLEVGTWHAGPYFKGEWVDFYNLELSDTNVTDHETVNLREKFGVEFEIKT